MQFLPGHVGRLGRCQIDHRISDVRSLAQVSERDLAEQCLALLFGQTGRHVSFDKTRCHTIDCDVTRSELTRKCTGQTRHPGLGSSIVGLPGVTPVSYTHLTLPTNREV